MRRTILLSLFGLLVVIAANDACAQRRGGGGAGFARGGYGFGGGRGFSPRGAGYASPPYGLGYGYSPYDYDAAYAYPLQPMILVQQPPVYVEQPPPTAVQAPVHPVVTDYKWSAMDMASSASAASITSETEPQSFGIILKDGSTVSAEVVFASEDGLHYVDPDGRHLRISMSDVNRSATLKLNRTRNLNLYLPAAE